MLNKNFILTVAAIVAAIAIPTASALAGVPSSVRVVLFQDPPPSVENGLDWPTAFVNLQDALDVANEPDSGITEIWVASANQHPYTPDQGGGQTPSDRSASFELQDDLAIYGGFAGGETLLEQRDIAANPTILSGDLNGDDNTGGSNAENSYHVVRATNLTDTTRLDGFTITAGNANGPDSTNDHRGGGVFLDGAEVQIWRCLISGNTASAGGGIFGLNIGPGCESGASGAAGRMRVIRCRIENNLATGSNFFLGDGGGANFWESHMVFLDCIFENNTSLSRGGGVSTLSVATCNELECVNCLFIDNSAESHGGGANINQNGILQIINSTFVGNSVEQEFQYGGGVAKSPESELVVTNSIFWENTTPGPAASEVVQIAEHTGACACGDLNGDDIVDGGDLGILLGAFGLCGAPAQQSSLSEYGLSEGCADLLLDQTFYQ